jgi:hypothetical protein
MSEEVLAITAVSGSAVQLLIPTPVQKDGVGAHYVTQQTNLPQKYANNIYVWKTTSDNVPWGTDPDGTVAVATDAPVGIQFVKYPFLLGQGYIVGYAVGANPTMTCTTVYIPADSPDDPTTYVKSETTISINSYGNGYVQLKLAGLGNYSPSSNKNWVGIWENDHVPYSGDPIAKADVSLGTSKGLIFLPVPLTIGSTYSVGYFVAPAPAAAPVGRTALACSATFST